MQHERQTAGPQLQAKLDRFRAYVRNAIDQNDLEVIAEECNEEIEKDRGKSICRGIAIHRTPALPYVACEPNREERKALGIPNSNPPNNQMPIAGIHADTENCRDAELLRYFPAREKYWLEQLRRITIRSVLLVVGANHVSTFTCRLTENGIPAEVICFDWVALDDAVHGPLPIAEQPL